MYIEHKNGYAFLVKKIAKKKLSIALQDPNNIDTQDIHRLSQVEFEYTASTHPYTHFKTCIHN